MDRGLADFAADDTPSDFLNLKVMSVEYTDNDHGTVVHVFGRDEDREWHRRRGVYTHANV